MPLATGRRPPSMSRGGMWPECGSDRLDGRRESRTREHGQGKGGKKGSAERGSRVSLQQMVFLFGLSFDLPVKKPTVWKNFACFACMHLHSEPFYYLPVIIITTDYYSGHYEHNTESLGLYFA